MTQDQDRFAPLFTRQGHLTMLSLDRYEVGELSDAARRSVESHVETCERCRGRYAAVHTRSIELMPPMGMRSDTGSATIGALATGGALALAASLLAAVGTTLWPAPRVVQEAESSATAVSSAYTSVAQEYSEPPRPHLEVTRDQGQLHLLADGEGTVALVLTERDTDGGTGGDSAEVIVDVVFAGPAGDRITVARPPAAPELQVFAVACLQPIDLVVGEPLPDDDSCTIVAAPQPADR